MSRVPTRSAIPKAMAMALALSRPYCLTVADRAKFPVVGHVVKPGTTKVDLVRTESYRFSCFFP